MILFFMNTTVINRGSDTYVTSINQRSIMDQSRTRICLLAVHQSI